MSDDDGYEAHYCLAVLAIGTAVLLIKAAASIDVLEILHYLTQR